MLNRYSLTHVIQKGGHITSINVFGRFSRRKLEKIMQELVNSIIGHGNENVYYTAITNEKNGGKTVTVKETKHTFQIDKL